MEMIFNNGFGGVMTADGKYGVQIVKTSKTQYPILHEFAEGWVYDSDCVCHNEHLGGECELEDLPDDVVEAMREFMEDYEGTIAERIKDLREWKGLSQDKFAKFLDIPVGTLRNWEQGISAPPEWTYKLIEFYVRRSAN